MPHARANTGKDFDFLLAVALRTTVYPRNLETFILISKKTKVPPLNSTLIWNCYDRLGWKVLPYSTMVDSLLFLLLLTVNLFMFQLKV